MSTHVPGFHSFFRFFASFCFGQISHQQLKGYAGGSGGVGYQACVSVSIKGEFGGSCVTFCITHLLYL